MLRKKAKLEKKILSVSSHLGEVGMGKCGMRLKVR